MAWPASVLTREIIFGKAVILETGADLSLRTVTRASRSLISLGEGFRMESLVAQYETNDPGEVVAFELPVTNQPGWADAVSRMGIEVGEDEHTHLYTTTLTIYSGTTQVKQYAIGPYPIPMGEGPIDGDTMLVPSETQSGALVPLPDVWAEIVADANALLNLRGEPNGIATLDGAGVVPETQLPERLSEDALKNTTVAKVADDHGGAVPAPIRVPTLTPHRVFPDGRVTWRVIYGDGNRIYAVGRDKSMRVSLNAGLNWAQKIRPMGEAAYGFKDCFLRLPNGDLVTLRNEGTVLNPSIQPYYSTAASDGSEWTAATGGPFSADTQPLGSQSLCRDDNTGYLYYAEYAITGPDNRSAMNVWRSTDDGRSWSIFHAFPGRSTSDPDRIRHLHSAQYDPYSQRVYVTAGDGESAAGLYRVNAAGTGLEPVVTNAQVGNLRACAIGLMFFPDYIVWGTDNSSDAALYRMHRNQIGQPTPTIEHMYRLAGSAWWSIKARDDGSMFLLSTSNEVASPGEALDTSSHLYAISDQGATVWEVGVIGDGDRTPVAVQPVGPGGDKFWMSSRFFRSNFSGWFSLDRAGIMSLPFAAPLQPLFRHVATAASGRLEVGANEAITFGHAVVPHGMPKLYAIDYGIRREPGGTTLRVRAIRESDEKIVAFIDGTSTSFAGPTGRGDADSVNGETLNPGDVILFQIAETAGNVGGTATAYVTYAFGPAESGASGDWDTL